MRPLDFYDLGMELAESARSEDLQRTVVNRLYYGLHHEACCRYFRENPEADPIRRSRRHRELGERFRGLSDSMSNEIAGLLRDLFDLRAECDYRLSPELRFRGSTYRPSEAMEMAVGQAADLLGLLERYSPGEAGDGCDPPVV